MATGLTKNQAKTFMQKYLDTNLPSYPGVYYHTQIVLYLLHGS